MFRPPDRLVLTLAQHPSVQKLLIAHPYQSWPVRRARQAAGRLSEVPFDLERPDTALVSPYRVRRRNPSNIAWAKHTYRSYDRFLHRAARRLGVHEPAVFTFHPMQAAFAPFEWAHSVTFYALDDYASHPDFRRYDRAYEEAYRTMRERGTRVCAVSRPLLDKLAPTGPSAVIPNGIDAGEWRRPAPAPAWFERLPQPRIVYTGVLLEDRFDWQVVRDVAQRFPGGSVVLAGEYFAMDEANPVHGLPNVHIVPQLNRADVVGVVVGADVCIIPHVRSRMTEAMSPLKLYEYLAGGRPVVATDLPPIRDIDRRVLLATDRTEFVDQVACALELGPMPEGERLAFIEANSWAQRHEQLISLGFA